VNRLPMSRKKGGCALHSAAPDSRADRSAGTSLGGARGFSAVADPSLRPGSTICLTSTAISATAIPTTCKGGVVVT